MLMSGTAGAQINWNDGQVKWYGHKEGMAAARLGNKPVLLIVYADWCGVCKEYSTMFTDPEVVKYSKNVVLIRLNQDTDRQFLAKTKFDAKYVPRTYILNKHQEIQPSPYKTDEYAFFLPPDSNDLLVKILKEMKP